VRSGRLGDRRLAIRLAAVTLFGATLGLASPGLALAGSNPVKLAILPVDQPGSFFDLKMAPGESRTFAVQISNDGSATLSVRTYAADVYTIINGGFGARLAGQPQSGMTEWLDYPMTVWSFAAGGTLRRTFMVSVPATAKPGEYISSLVLENAEPIEVSGAVGVNQFIRQALGVVVTVPGPRLPALVIGAASTKEVAGSTVVSVAIANTGNVRLQPKVQFALLDAAGDQISQASSQMGTVYAGTSTFLEVPLAALLPPGSYSLRLTFVDSKQGLSVDAGPTTFVVGGPAATAPAGGEVAGLTPVTIFGGPTPASTPWAWLLIAGLLAVAGLLGLAAARGRRRRTSAS
jgi:hypothetical protein